MRVRSGVRKVQRAIGRDEGFTLVEVGIATGLLGTVLAIAFGALVSFQTAIGKSDTRSQSNDQARLAVEQIDRQVRSGNVLYDPAAEGANAGTNPDGSAIPSGFSMRIYTQSNALERCVQWRLLNTNDLQKRAWSQSWRTDGQVSGWHTVAQSVVNTTSNPPFALDTSANYGGANSRLVKLDLVSNVNSTHGSNVQVETPLEARNTEYVTPTSGPCSDMPPP